MSQTLFERLLRRVRGLHIQQHFLRADAPDFDRSTSLATLDQELKSLDRLKAGFTPNLDEAALITVAEHCDACDPNDPAVFSDGVKLVREELLLLIPIEAAEEEEATEPETIDAGVDPVIDRMVGLLQTQTANIENRYEDLNEEGANLDEGTYRPLATNLSILASVLRKRLESGTATVTFAQLQRYRSRRSDATGAPAHLFFQDLVRLRDYLLKLLEADVQFVEA